ncbi:MAG: 4Fe-4S binding protein [Syntrophomonadaceae bacterium]|jgi:MinD superfamily P-loop ATPase|nr:ATP-binding protein [Bacillota bacterium]HQD91342.1 ATP-binding protein [Syntrophomonadaceae bacterium]
MSITISVASGKGGTGKTLVATSLARVLAERHPLIIDTDVEEPNAALFLPVSSLQSEPVCRPIPFIDVGKCTNCGICAKVCEFGALVVLSQEVLVFPELCHSCGACVGLCPEKAISEEKRMIGEVETGIIDGIGQLAAGRLNIGENLSPPVIKAAKEKGTGQDLVIIDCPPGTTCPMIEAVRGSDYCLLVTEPTPFGKHDLALALEACKLLGIESGIIINRWQEEDNGIMELAEQADTPVLGFIPFSLELAKAYGRGEDPLQAMPELREILTGIIRQVEERRL